MTFTIYSGSTITTCFALTNLIVNEGIGTWPIKTPDHIASLHVSLLECKAWSKDFHTRLYSQFFPDMDTCLFHLVKTLPFCNLPLWTLTSIYSFDMEPLILFFLLIAGRVFWSLVECVILPLTQCWLAGLAETVGVVWLPESSVCPIDLWLTFIYICSEELLLLLELNQWDKFAAALLMGCSGVWVVEITC